jgi:hypothetical protein
MGTNFGKHHTLRNLGKLLREIKRKRNNKAKNIEQTAEGEGMELISMGTDRLYIIYI